MIIAIYIVIAICIVAWLISVFWVARQLGNAQEGYENKKGFHYGKPHTK